MENPGQRSVEQLLAEVAWMRRLARSLVKDAAAADDVVQEAWLVAQQRAPVDGRPLRPWLVRVITNIVRMRGRGEKRREARELVVDSSPSSAATPEELVAQVELQRLLAGFVLDLDDPYRSTILLHYYEHLSSAEIARRLGVPDGTVRWRLKHALDTLRERLDSKHGGKRSAWMLPLMQFADVRRPMSSGASAMLAKLVVVTGVLLAVGWLAASFIFGGPPRARQATVAASAADPSAGVVSLRQAPDPSPVAAWLTQAGAPPRRIAGRVLFDGQPVAGAAVQLDLDSPLRAGAPVRRVVSGMDGAFDLGEQQAATYTVSAIAPGKAAVSERVELGNPRAKPDPDALVLELGDCRSRIRGRVLDVAGGPIASARLLVQGLVGAGVDAGGRFDLCVPLGDTSLRVDANGYGSTRIDMQLYGQLHRDIVLVPEANVLGQVVHAVSRAPVAGARVLGRPDVGGGLALSAVSDADGRFRLSGVTPGGIHLTAFADGLGPAGELRVVADVGGEPADVVVSVTSLARIRGRVVMAGKPVVGALVGARSRGGSGLPVGAFSQDDGQFVLDGVPRADDVQLSAWPYAVQTPATVAVDDAQFDGLTIEVTKMASVGGRVTRHGLPLRGALVLLQPCAAPVHSDAEGRFLFEGVWPGTCQLQAADYRTRAFTQGRPIAVSPGQAQTELGVELDGGARVSGVVVDQVGARVPGVYVHFSLIGNGDEGQAMTDEHGAFECWGMLGGGDYVPDVFPDANPQQPFATASGQSFPVVHVANGDTQMDGVRLAIAHQVLTIRGQVIDAAGNPVPDASVRAQAVGGPATRIPVFSMIPAAPVWSGADGSFSIGRLAPGRYQVIVNGADSSDATVDSVPAGTSDLAVTLTKRGVIEVELDGFGGSTVAYARNLDPRSGWSFRYVVAGDHLTIPALPPGWYLVGVHGSGRADARRVEVHPGETLQLVLHNRGQARIEGRVVDHRSGAPLANMPCRAVAAADGVGGDDEGPNPKWVTDAAGRFIIEPAPAGRTRVECFPTAARYSVAAAEVDIAVGETAHVALVAVKEIIGRTATRPGFQAEPHRSPITVLLVEPGGLADTAGMIEGDVIVAVDGESVAAISPNGVMTLVGNHRSGSHCRIDVLRGGQARTITLGF